MTPQRIEKLADRIFDQIWAVPATGLPHVVYHYTNAEGLFGILSSRRVWATDCRFLNDETESQIGLRLAAQIAHSRFSDAKSDVLRRFYEQAGYYFRAESDEKNFVFSLSSRRDDLTQWRTYARDGQGFTIGFNTATLIENSASSDAKYGFSRIIYDAQLQSLQINKHVSTIEEALKNVEPGDPEFESVIHEAALCLEWVVSHQSILLKHSSFESEKEWRINTFPDEDEGSAVRVRASGGRLVPYVELKLSGDDRCLPISCIGIGPGFRNSAIQFAVDKLCKQTGFDVEIYNADTPYRRV